MRAKRVAQADSYCETVLGRGGLEGQKVGNQCNDESTVSTLPGPTDLISNNNNDDTRGTDILKLNINLLAPPGLRVVFL